MEGIGHGLRWMDEVRCNGKGYFAIDIVATEKQELFEWDGPPYIPNINMLDVYINGVFQQKTAYLESSGNSIRYLAQVYISENDVISIRYRPTGFNFGNIKVFSTIKQLEKVQNPSIGEVVLVLDEKVFYMYNNKGEWEKIAQLVQTLEEEDQKYLFEKDFEITEDNVLTGIIEWDAPEYIIGISMLDVYLNGILLYRTDFEELTPNSILYKGQTEIIQKDIITIKYRYTKVNFGNISVKESIDAFNEIYKPTIGSCALAKQQRKIYQWDGEKWSFLIDLSSNLIEITTENSKTIELNSNNDTITADLKISKKLGNQIKLESDGIYVSSLIQDVKVMTVENVMPNQSIIINKAEEDYGIDSLGVLKVYELIQNLDQTEILNDYTMGNESNYIYDKDAVEFTLEGATLKNSEILEMNYVRDLENGYKLYTIDIDLSKYKKILI